MSKIAIQHIFKQKLKVGNSHCLLKTLKYKYCPVQNKFVTYRPGIYNLQTRTVTFPDQEKLRQKVDLRYLKTLKPKKLKTTNSYNYVMAYRRNLYNLQTRKKQLKK